MRLARYKNAVHQIESTVPDHYGCHLLVNIEDNSCGYSVKPDEYVELTGNEYWRQLDGVNYFKALFAYEKTQCNLKKKLEAFYKKQQDGLWHVYDSIKSDKHFALVKFPGPHEFNKYHVVGIGADIVPQGVLYTLSTAVRYAMECFYRNTKDDWKTRLYIYTTSQGDQ